MSMDLATERRRIAGLINAHLAQCDYADMVNVIAHLKTLGVNREWGAAVLWEMCANRELQRRPMHFSVRKA